MGSTANGELENSKDHTKRQVIVSTLHPGSVQSGIIQLSDMLVRPTFGGAAVIMHCLLGNIKGGVYVDELLTSHPIHRNDFHAESWFQTKPLSLPGRAIEENMAKMGRSTEEVQGRLWIVSEK